MSEEQIQSDVELEQPAVEPEEAEQSETATDEQSEPEQQQEPEPDYQKIIAEKAFEARQAKREKEELAKRLEQLEANAPKEQRPNVPPMPDPFDDDYESKIKQREETLIAQAQFDAQARIMQEQEQQKQQAAYQKQQESLTKRVTDYSTRAEQLGVDKNELAQAGQRLQGQVSDDVASYILDNDQGPLITKYLAANPLELDKLSGLNAMQAAVYLETQVKSKAAQFGTKKVTQAPEPVDTLRGSGAAPEHPSLKGAQWK